MVPSSLMRSSCGGGGGSTPEKVTVTVSPTRNLSTAATPDAEADPFAAAGAVQAGDSEKPGVSVGGVPQPTSERIRPKPQPNAVHIPKRLRAPFMRKVPVILGGTGQYLDLISTRAVSPAVVVPALVLPLSDPLVSESSLR